MTALVSVETVRNRLALPDDNGVNAVIESAIEGATAYVEAKLKTSVTPPAAAVSDWFRVDDLTLNRDSTFRMLLSNGFVDDVVVGVTDTIEGVTTVVTPLKIESEKGLVVIAIDPVPAYYKITYTYGFAEVDDVPQWLQEVAMSYVVQLMSMQQVNDQKEEISKLYKFVQTHGTEVLDAHLRRDAFAIRPML